MFSPPTPHRSTLRAMLLSLIGLRSSSHGSTAGLTAVPKPAHLWALSVTAVPGLTTSNDEANTLRSVKVVSRSGRSLPHSPFRPFSSHASRWTSGGTSTPSSATRRSHWSSVGTAG